MFVYGTWNLWTDIERFRIEKDDRRSFADIAQLAVHMALDLLPGVSQNHIAHDFVIWEFKGTSDDKVIAEMVYCFDTLRNE